MGDIRPENISALVDKRNRSKIIKESVQELKVVRNTVWQFLICLLVASFLGVAFTYHANTVEVSRTLFSVVLEADIAFFAVILGSYAIFQALMRDEILKHLLSIESTILIDSNKSFLNLSILYIVDIFLSFVAKMFAESVSMEWCIGSVFVSNILYCTFVILYLLFFLLLLLENINFTINLYRMFNVYTVYRSLDMLDEEEKKQP